jgi:hypothetical protein
MSEIPHERLGFASSLFNIMANLGSATGIALFSSILTTRHHSYLTQLTADAMTHLAPGADPATAIKAAGPMAWLLAYNHIYRTLMYIAMIVAPSCLLLKRPASGASLDAALD